MLVPGTADDRRLTSRPRSRPRPVCVPAPVPAPAPNKILHRHIIYRCPTVGDLPPLPMCCHVLEQRMSHMTDTWTGQSPPGSFFICCLHLPHQCPKQDSRSESLDRSSYHSMGPKVKPKPRSSTNLLLPAAVRQPRRYSQNFSKVHHAQVICSLSDTELSPYYI